MVELHGFGSAVLLRSMVVATACVLAATAVDSAVAATPTVTWCGSEWSARDRTPEAVAGQQTHIIYAVPQGRLGSSSAAGKIATDIAAIDTWWRNQDPTRTPRFDLFSFPNCGSAFGKLDISHVLLPQAADYYAPDRYKRISDDLRNVGFAVSGKKYLVYYDALPVGTEDGYCGWGGGSYAIVFLGVCRQDLGTGQQQAAMAAHELTHALGAVAHGAPHRCSESGHVCDRTDDLMYPMVPWLPNAILDPGRDDYYGHSGSWTDVQDSQWLSRVAQPQRTLTTLVSGAGGRITSDVPGVDCTSSCASSWDDGTGVVLRATPPAGMVLARWEGACSGSSATCSLTMNVDKAVTAVFGAAPPPSRTLTIRRTGNGSVTSSPAGITCGSECSASFAAGTTVILSAAPATGYSLSGWSGACSGAAATCTLSLSSDSSVTATFSPVAASAKTLTVSRVGSGTVTSTPSGINCGSTCSFAFPHGRTVALRATAASGYAFSRWSGGCSGSGSCAVSLTANKSVAAYFARVTTTVAKATVSVRKAGSGAGTVTSTPAAISCGSTCSASVAKGTSIRLRAIAAPGSVFLGWSGSCSGTGSCSLNVNVNKSVTATFGRPLPKRQHCNVPRVVGKTLGAAKRAIKAGHCSLGRVGFAHSSRVRKGRIVRQRPRAGATLKAGTKVAVVVSRG